MLHEIFKVKLSDDQIASRQTQNSSNELFSYQKKKKKSQAVYAKLNCKQILRNNVA